jgi:hypothetical protein
MKTMRVTLEIDVDDLPADERKRHAEEMEMSVDDIPALANTEAREAAEPLEYIGGDIITDLFAGTDTFVTYKDVRVLAAEYVETGARSRSMTALSHSTATGLPSSPPTFCSSNPGTSDRSHPWHITAATRSATTPRT